MSKLWWWARLVATALAMSACMTGIVALNVWAVMQWMRP